MITAIIAILVALATTIWAFIERHAKKLLHDLVEGMKLEDIILQEDLTKTKTLLADERAFLSMEKKKNAALEAYLTTAKENESGHVKSMAVEPEEIDVTGLVEVTEPFKIGDNERVVFFEFYKDKSAPKEIRWRLKAKNNKVLADSGEGYGTKQNLKKALGVMLNAIKKGELKSKWRA